MIASVALEIDLKNIRLSQCIIIDIMLYSKHNIYRLYVLLNTDAQVSFLSQKIIIKEGFWADSVFMSAMTVDSHLITVYS